MRRFKKSIQMLAALAAMTIAAAPAYAESTLDRIISSKKITIAVQNDVPPYSRIGANNEVEGLDIDIAKAIAKDLGVQLDMLVVTGANRVPALVTNKADLVIATVGINPQRAATVALSNPYTSYPMVMIASKDTAMKAFGDTSGKVIGVTRGTMQDDIVTRFANGADVRRYDDDATVIQSLATNQIDGTVFGTSVADDLAKRFPDLHLEQKFDAFSVYAGIAMRRSDTDLLQWVNTWIFFNEKNGYLNELHKKWLGIPMPPLH
ncbi:transporter substrate-binding domain-containing protein [Rhizobium sp. P38BS-XIX]|uniref:transporter substrate-binding domain-containing protein n=1 Tax=Rhizobium sp. P38BS-XIX TaxID=2726740 RepID=UPI0014573938|nr:transporter substrate-binding domain-containing protein [Rhizobium sp. P38BS-XIX]NLS01622.1 transporter substrate-binding domain-containing protein [Rhizobium sp. P38BS-XIX]